MCGMRKLRTLDIVDYVKAKKRCTLAHLMQKFKVSSATIHRDVAELVAAGHLERVRGGVAFFPRTEAAPTAFGTFHDRASVNREAKERIAARALEYVTEGDILFLDSSSTTAALASAIAARAFTNITLVTNSVAIMENFHKMPRNYVLIALGGNYDPQLNSFLGSSALRELERLTVSKAFVSCFGVDDKTVTTNHEHQAGLVTRVLELASKRYLLADRSKFGRTGLYRLAARGLFDAVISERRGS
jgi:DeoR/GlpR family transcriptional regulator of sugar metabolism